MSLANTLRAATADAHRQAERRPLQLHLVRGTLPRPVLVAYLAQLEAMHEALESAIASSPVLAGWLDWSERYEHSRRLAADITALTDGEVPGFTGVTRRIVDQIEHAEECCPHTLLGMFYVLEGSMNGNRFIVRALRQGPLAETCSFTYFDPYGEEQSSVWASFRAKLDSVECTEADTAHVVDGALQMFGAIAEIADVVFEEAGVVVAS